MHQRRVELENPIQLVILNSEDELYEWREHDTQSIGGEAFTDFGTTIQIFEKDMQEGIQEAWINEVVPHEISHLYFFQAIGKDYKDIPRWLNEGLAGYNEFNDHGADWAMVRQAIQQDALIPLGELRNDFPEGDEKVSLSYAECTTTAIYIIETYGQDSLNKLFSAYQAGENSDAAFKQAFGRNVADFEKDWQAWVVTQQSTPDNSVVIIFLAFTILSLICGGSLLILVILLITTFNKKIKINVV